MADCVILLHGLSRSGYSMLALQEALKYQGYEVINESYETENVPVEQMVAHVGERVARCGDQRVHFITHSLGGIITRAWLQDHRPAQMGRVVMLAPPNHGSEIVDAMAGSPNEMISGMLALFGGSTARVLGTDETSLPNSLPPVDFELGVIAGNRAISPLGPLLIDGPNDGTVSVESTRIDGMRDHLVLPATHTLIMNNPIAIAQSLHFLREGAFLPELSWTEAVRQIANKSLQPKEA